MKKFIFDDSWKNLNCLLPAYNEEGINCTHIFLDSQESFLDERTVRSCLKALTKIFAVDLKSLRKKYGAVVNRKNSIPLPLHPQLVLVPMKSRKPQKANHGSWGYFVLDKIIGYRALEEKDKTEIVFSDYTKITVLLNIVSVKEILNDAQIVKSCYLNLLKSKNDIIKEVSSKCPYLTNPNP